MTNAQKYLIMCQQALANAAHVQTNRVVKYANSDEPFANFIASAEFADTTVVRGILTRIGDKFGRLKNVLEAFEAEQPLPVASDESLNDTFDDIINYVNILRVWLLTDGGRNYPEGIPEGWADGALVYLDPTRLEQLVTLNYVPKAVDGPTEPPVDTPVEESAPAPAEPNLFRELLKKVTGQGA